MACHLSIVAMNRMLPWPAVSFLLSVHPASLQVPLSERTSAIQPFFILIFLAAICAMPFFSGNSDVIASAGLFSCALRA